MTQPSKIHIVLPVANTALQHVGDMHDLALPGVVLSKSQITTGCPWIEGKFDDCLSIPETLDHIIQAERDGADAVVIDCMADTAFVAARESVRIPVLAACHTAMAASLLLGDNFAVLSPYPPLNRLYRSNARAYGLEHKLVGVRALSVPPATIDTTSSAFIEALADAGAAAVREDGAEVLILGATGMLHAKDRVVAALGQRGIAVPVIDPLPVAIQMADTLVKLALAHSKISYPELSAKPIQGFAHLSNLNRRTS